MFPILANCGSQLGCVACPGPFSSSSSLFYITRRTDSFTPSTIGSLETDPLRKRWRNRTSRMSLQILKVLVNDGTELRVFRPQYSRISLHLKHLGTPRVPLFCATIMMKPTACLDVEGYIQVRIYARMRGADRRVGRYS